MRITGKIMNNVRPVYKLLQKCVLFVQNNASVSPAEAHGNKLTKDFLFSIMTDLFNMKYLKTSNKEYEILENYFNMLKERNNE